MPRGHGVHMLPVPRLSANTRRRKLALKPNKCAASLKGDVSRAAWTERASHAAVTNQTGSACKLKHKFTISTRPCSINGTWRLIHCPQFWPTNHWRSPCSSSNSASTPQNKSELSSLTDPSCSSALPHNKSGAVQQSEDIESSPTTLEADDCEASDKMPSCSTHSSSEQPSEPDSKPRDAGGDDRGPCDAAGATPAATSNANSSSSSSSHENMAHDALWGPLSLSTTWLQSTVVKVGSACKSM